MSVVDESSLNWNLAFELDEDAEEELADDPEPIVKALITDETISKCRIIAAIRCIEYGTVESAPRSQLDLSSLPIASERSLC